MYLQDKVNAFIGVSGNAKLTLYGGKNKLRVFAPYAVEVGENATVEVHDVFFVKNSGNMMGLFCARRNSRVYAYDSIFVSDKNRNAVYTQDAGQMYLENCTVVSADNSTAVTVSDGTSLTVTGDSYLLCSGKLSGAVELGNGVYFTELMDLSAYSTHGAVTMNLYVPEYLLDYGDAEIHISVDGLTYTPKRSDGVPRSIEGEDYVCFSYPYIYPGRLLDESELNIFADGVEYISCFTVRDKLIATLGATEDEDILSALVPYLDYALLASYDPEREQLLSDYNVYLSERSITATSPEVIRSVYMDAEEGVIKLYTESSTDPVSALIMWGISSVTVYAEDGVLSVPLFRLDPGEKIWVIYTSDGTTHNASFYLIELYALVEDSPSRSSELFLKYLCYLFALDE